MYDAVIILGGSYIDENTLPLWSQKRLDLAYQQDSKTKMFILLSRATAHKPPCLDSNGYPFDECNIMGNYLMEKGIDPKKILMESWSKDTIGNAYAALTMHVIPRNLQNLLIITSDFHMPRSKDIFQYVFSLSPIEILKLDFLESKSELKISQKEANALTRFAFKMTLFIFWDYSI